MNYLFILGIGSIIFGICFIVTYLKEKYNKHILIHGKVIDIMKSVSTHGHSIEYTPIIEYEYNGNKYTVEHRISSTKTKYKVNDIVELKLYINKPDKVIINSKINLLMPIIVGIPLIMLGIMLLIIWFSLR